MDSSGIIMALQGKLNILRGIITDNNDNGNYSRYVYSPICVCMDVIGDTLLVLKDYFSLKCCGEGSRYVLLYGLAQCFRLQIQAVEKLYSITKVNDNPADYFIESRAFSDEILDIIINTSKKCCFIPRPSMSDFGCDISISLLGLKIEEISKHVDYKEVIDSHLDDLNKCLDRIIFACS